MPAVASPNSKLASAPCIVKPALQVRHHNHHSVVVVLVVAVVAVVVAAAAAAAAAVAGVSGALAVVEQEMKKSRMAK